MKSLAELKEQEIQLYRSRTSQSASFFLRAQDVIVGSSSRSPLYFPPYPIFIKKGEGTAIWDLDGNQYLDLLNNYTALILGHAYPKVVEKVQKATSEGLSFGAPHPSETELAECIRERLPSMEVLRFVNSGTEAVAYAIRAARAYTGRTKVAKFEGAFHGGYDFVQVSVAPPLDKIGSPNKPLSVGGLGVTPGVVGETVILPFNNLEACTEILKNCCKELAALIVDPFMCVPGLIEPQPGFLEALRLLTADLGIVLIFDEVVTFRLSRSGAQGIYGIHPDLTVLGKIIGGGLPIGAYGGRVEIMKVLDVLAGGKFAQGGTFNSNPITMAAGLATLKELTVEALAYINELGDFLRQSLRQKVAPHHPNFQITGQGSLFNMHFNRQAIVDYRVVLQDDKEKMNYLFFALLNQGFYLAPRGYGSISLPTRREDISLLVEAIDQALAPLAD